MIMVMEMNMAVFWDVAPCSLVEVYRRFGDDCYLHHQDDEISDGNKTSGFITGRSFLTNEATISFSAAWSKLKCAEQSTCVM
jgi:hypothetical protein